MPMTSEDIANGGKAAIDFYLRKKPVDQVAIERPLLKALQAKKKTAPGAKQFIVEQIRKGYGSNFQWYSGSSIVTYNRRQSLEQANFAWRSAHDGMAISEDEFTQNGIVFTDDSNREASDAEVIQLTNILTERTEILRLGFQEKFSFSLHADGTQNPDAIAGLESLVSLTPTTGTVGGIDRSLGSNGYWRNNVATGLTSTTGTGTILNSMEVAWRNCARNGGRPDLILMGSTFYDAYRNFVMNTFGRIDFGPSEKKKIEGGTDDNYTFKGVGIQWSPEFQELDAQFTPAIPWEKRCYFINSQTITLRPMEGHDMISRKPPRVYDRYEHYWAMTWKGGLTMNRANANAVLSLV